MGRILFPLLLGGLLAVLMTGCVKNISDVPEDINQNQVRTWYTATGAVKVIAESTKGVTESVISINNSDPKIIPPDDYQRILLVLGKTAQAGIHLDAVLKNAPNNFEKGVKDQIMAEIRPVVDELQQADLEGLFSKSRSPRMQTELAVVKTLTQSARLLLALAQ